MKKQKHVPAEAEVENVLDEAEKDETIPAVHYEITSFGADYDVEGMVSRLKRGEIQTPDFQRGYVWNIRQASKFIESLLLGLPVPGVFLARETDSKKFIVIDGQQRLKTLQFFFDGNFNPKPEEATKKIFKLVDVQKQFVDRTYESLEAKDRIQLNNSIIHATIVKQDAPPDENTSIYHIFERLNATGLKLTPQEVRAAAYHGPLIQLLKELNADPNWRRIFGKESIRLKDQELILRFLALYRESEKYEKPINEFMNRFAARHQAASTKFLQESRKVFTTAIALVLEGIGEKAFRPAASLNAAVFDSVMVGIAKRVDKRPLKKPTGLATAYEKLLRNESYQAATISATSDETNVSARLNKAIEAFQSVE